MSAAAKQTRRHAHRNWRFIFCVIKAFPNKKTPRPGSLDFGKRGGFCWCKDTAFIRIGQTLW